MSMLCFQLMINIIDNYDDVEKYTLRFISYVSFLSIIPLCGSLFQLVECLDVELEAWFHSMEAHIMPT